MSDSQGKDSEDARHDVSREKPEKLLLRIQYAEKTERFDEMVSYVKDLVKEHPDFLEKNGQLELVSVAFKNAVGERRSAWRVVLSLREEEGQTTEKQAVEEAYLGKLGSEISTICTDLLKLVDDDLLKVVVSPEAKVLLLKLKGDYFRYLTEIQSEEKYKESIASAQTAYDEALELGLKELSPAHPNMLGLGLNLSLFHCITLGNVDKACQMVKKGIEVAEEKLEELEEGKKQESQRLLQVMKDNLEAWTSDN